MTQSQATPEPVSRLHVYYGLTSRERSSRQAIGAARLLVYDWHLTGPDTDYGPLKRGGSSAINWQLLEAICSIIGRNMEHAVDGGIDVPQNLRYAIPYRTLPDPQLPHDWAGLSGMWIGTYSFLDYADLFQYNFGDRPGPRPSLDDLEEAFGDLMRLELKLDDGLANDRRMKSTLPYCDDLPILYFSGTSRDHAGTDRPGLTVRGRVSLAPGGREVKWKFIVRYVYGNLTLKGGRPTPRS